MVTKMKINSERVMRRLKAIYEAGLKSDGSHSRIAFSEEDRRGRSIFTSWAIEAGLEVKTDEAGNLYIKYAGSDDSLPAIGIGSHLDTVPDGGMYDGAVGCVAALEICQVMKEESYIPTRSIEIIVFADEEGVRFGDGLFGSSYACGVTKEINYAESDVSGASRSEVMQDYSGNIERLDTRFDPSSELAFFVELHIEQGGKLDSEDMSIGVVTSIAGVSRRSFKIIGEANHAGSTAMRDRKDALVTAAGIIAQVPNIVEEFGGEYTVATVGEIKNEPNSVNVIPGACAFSLEVRDQSAETMEQIEGKVFLMAEELCKKKGTCLKVEQISDSKPMPMADVLINIIEKSVRDMGEKYMKLPSGAFHDSLVMASCVPTGMIFIPSVGGISHSRFEYTKEKDIEKGCNVLLGTILQIEEADAFERQGIS